MNASGMTIRERLRGVVKDPSVREAFFVFTLTRALLLAIVLATAVANYDYRLAPDYHPDDPHPVVSLKGVKILKSLEHTLGRGDVGWYQGIAQNGYERIPFEGTTGQHSWAFFPLYPVLLGFVGRVIGYYTIPGALLSSAFFFVALVLLHKLVLGSGFGSAVADRAVFYTAVFPASYFSSLPMTEGLCLMLMVASFLAAERGRWWAAGVCGAFTSATRLSGVLLTPALTLLYAQRTRRESWGPQLLWLAMIPLGLLSFMVFLWSITGNPLAFVDVQKGWNRNSAPPWTTLYEYLSRPRSIIEPWNFRALNFAAAILGLGAAVFWAARKHWAFATFTLFSVLLPLATGTLQSNARYMSVVFPIFIALAIAGQRPRLDQTIRVVFLVLFTIMTFSFAMRLSFASS
jgi:hypothetical protein